MSPFDRLVNPAGSLVRSPLRSDASPAQRAPASQLLAAGASVLPLAAVASWSLLRPESSVGIAELMLGPLVGGGLQILWLLWLHCRVCGDRVASLGLATDRWKLELGFGVVLTIALFLVQGALAALLGPLVRPRPPAPEIVELIVGLSRRPLLLALWLGPVVWIGVALFEELWRAFFLRRLVRAWPGRAGRAGALLVTALLVGLAHLYQSPLAAVTIGVLSLLQGWFLLATGRLWALIVAHALFDSIQILSAVVVLRSLPE